MKKTESQRYAPYLCVVLLLTLPACGPVDDRTETPETIRTASGIEMVLIPAGSFEMGSSTGQDDEQPVRLVSVSSFWMDRYEVTQDEFPKYELSDPSHFKNPKNPLEQINWTDAALYCNDRSRAEGFEPCYDEQTWECDFDANGYRLATEAEWEYACRAGSETRFSFGDDERALSGRAWYGQNAGGRTHPVGRKKPNRWGLYDMHGNVAEWCNDWYGRTYYRDAPSQDPKGPPQGEERVLRGGAWNSSADSCRSSHRASDPSLNDTCLASDTIGFRCVRRASEGNRVKQGKDEPNAAPSTTGFLYDDIYLEHETTPGHPESPQRLAAVMGRLRTSGCLDRCGLLRPRPAATEWLTSIHERRYVQRARRACEEGAAYLDTMDVPICRRSYEVAVMAAGGVLVAVDAVVENKVQNAFCAVRPPGHHALRDRALGFCIFNNVAIGARYVQQRHGLERVLIVDWDVHHGNGTQEAFYSDPNVMYFSVHRYPFYPGTGSAPETGGGPGVHTVVNVPLAAGAGDDEFVAALREKLIPAADAFAPDFVFISAGFDAHEHDLLGGMKVTADGFDRLTRIVKDIADRHCRGRIVSVLEGGYGLDGLAASVEAHLRVLMG